MRYIILISKVLIVIKLNPAFGDACFSNVVVLFGCSFTSKLKGCRDCNLDLFSSSTLEYHSAK